MEIVRYLTGIPKKIPEGLVVVHNFRPGDPNRAVRDGGFRIFLGQFENDEEMGPPCDCGWRDGVLHYESPPFRKARLEAERLKKAQMKKGSEKKKLVKKKPAKKKRSA